MFRAFTLSVALFICANSATAQDQQVSYGDIEKMAKAYADGGQIKFARIELTPGKNAKDKDTATLIPADNTLAQVASEYDAEHLVLNFLIEKWSYKKLFEDNEILKKHLEATQLNSKRMYELIFNDKQKSTDKKVIELLIEQGDSSKKVWFAFCREKGYKVSIGHGAVFVEAFLSTDPPNAKICMLSKFEYEFARLRGKDADEELRKHVVGKIDPFTMAGKFVYLLEWKDGKVSKASEVSIPNSGKYILK